MEIEDLRILARVAHVQNLSAVGAEFELSAGTISKRLQAIESSLGVRLFDRSTRAIAITDEGQKFLDDIESIIARYDEACGELTRSVEQPQGRLRVSVPTNLGRGVLGPAFGAFMRRYPKVDLYVESNDRMITFPDSGFDVAIRTGNLQDSTLIAKRLGPHPRLLVAAPRYFREHGMPETPADLQRHWCLVQGDTQSWLLRRGDETHEVRLMARLRSNDGELLRHTAIEGGGILKAAHVRVREALAEGDLLEVLPDYDVGRNASVWAVYPSTRHMLPKLRVFLDFLSVWYLEQRRAEHPAHE
jgi:DNA-binding transcriptional LysR family regulator